MLYPLIGWLPLIIPHDGILDNRGRRATGKRRAMLPFSFSERFLLKHLTLSR